MIFNEKKLEKLGFKKDYHSNDETTVYVKKLGNSIDIYIFNTNGDWGYCFGEQELENSFYCTYSSFNDCLSFIKDSLNLMKDDINKMIDNF